MCGMKTLKIPQAYATGGQSSLIPSQCPSIWTDGHFKGEVKKAIDQFGQIRKSKQELCSKGGGDDMKINAAQSPIFEEKKTPAFNFLASEVWDVQKLKAKKKKKPHTESNHF